MAKQQREISNEQILYYIMNLREQEAKNDKFTNIVINRELCHELGYFNYKLKDTGEVRASSLFLISETHDGELINIIYDNKGRFIGWQNEENRRQNKIDVSEDIELNEQILKMQLQKGIERTKDTENGTSSSDTAKAGEGRDLASKEHEEEKKEDNKETQPNNENGDTQQKNTLKNLRNEVNLDHKPKIRLDQVINGYYLWQILQIEQKLQGKLPEGLNEAAFRNGYLTIVDSKELEEKDHKPRKAEDTFLICTYSGDIIELDEQILQPMDLGGLEQRKQSELTRQRYEDGKEEEKPDTETELTRTSLYKIPNANERFAVAENWFLGVDKNRARMTNGVTTPDNVDKNISFVQVSRNQSYYTREEKIQNTVEYKLDPIRENVPKNEKELEKEQELIERKPNETEVERAEHTDDLVEICFKKYKNLRRNL